MKRIKRLNEAFAEDVSGGGFNSSNGVFKVSYIPYKDLSKPTGRDATKDMTPLSKYQMGDIVSGKTISNKKIQGPIVRLEKRPDNKGTNFYVKDIETNRVHKINPYSIHMIQDTGNIATNSTINTSIAKSNTEMARYLNNPVALGSLESKKEKYKNFLFESTSFIDSNYTINFKGNNSKTSIAIPSELENDYIERLKYEAKEIARRKLSETELAESEIFEALCDLWAIKKLQSLFADYSYKLIISDFMSNHNISYGEFQDKNLSLITKYL
jgi:hypothetical protein